MQALGLARVSTKEQQEGFSLSAQTNLLKDYSKNNNLDLMEVIEIAESASGSKNRKLFQALISRLSKDKKIGHFVCEKSDRVTRNLPDIVVIQEWLDRDERNTLHLVKENLVITKNSKSSETLIWNIKASLAKFYSDNLREEVMKGMTEKALSGHYPNGGQKFGYRSTEKDGRKVTVVDPVKSKVVDKIFSSHLGGISIREIAQQVKLTKSQTQRILRDPFYIGNFKWSGILYEGKHEPIISRSSFQAVQDKLDGKFHPRTSRRNFAYGRGLIQCATCKTHLIGELQKGRIYYACDSCKGQRYLREDLIDSTVLSHLAQFKIDTPKIQVWVKKAMQEFLDQDNLFEEDLQKTIQLQIADLRKRRQEVYLDHKKGLINYEFAREEINSLTEEITNLSSSATEDHQAEGATYKLAVSILELASKSEFLFKNRFGPEEKWQFLKILTEDISRTHENLEIRFNYGLDRFLVSPVGRYSNFLTQYLNSIKQIEYSSLIDKQVSDLLQYI